MSHPTKSHKRLCKKRKYRDEITAKIALSKVRSQDKSWRSKLECRAYKCPSCHKWHLTSMEKYSRV